MANNCCSMDQIGECFVRKKSLHIVVTQTKCRCLNGNIQICKPNFKTASLCLFWPCGAARTCLHSMEPPDLAKMRSVVFPFPPLLRQPSTLEESEDQSLAQHHQRKLAGHLPCTQQEKQKECQRA